jgi:hypothetical protein
MNAQHQPRLSDVYANGVSGTSDDDIAVRYAMGACTAVCPHCPAGQCNAQHVNGYHTCAHCGKHWKI